MMEVITCASRYEDPETTDDRLGGIRFDEFINKGLQIQTNTSIDPGIDTLQLAFDQSGDKHNHRFSLSESYPGLRIFTKISSSCALWTVIRARLIIKETPFPHSLHVNAKIQLVGQ